MHFDGISARKRLKVCFVTSALKGSVSIVFVFVKKWSQNKKKFTLDTYMIIVCTSNEYIDVSQSPERNLEKMSIHVSVGSPWTNAQNSKTGGGAILMIGILQLFTKYQNRNSREKIKLSFLLLSFFLLKDIFCFFYWSHKNVLSFYSFSWDTLEYGQLFQITYTKLTKENLLVPYNSNFSIYCCQWTFKFSSLSLCNALEQK